MVGIDIDMLMVLFGEGLSVGVSLSVVIKWVKWFEIKKWNVVVFWVWGK